MGPRHDAVEVAAALGVADAKFLGAGTFGDTWRVGDTAVKIICVDGYPPERVSREVAGLSRVSSPFVVELIADGTVSLGGKNLPALTFEYVPGGDLQDRIDAADRPDASEVQSLVQGLLLGVFALHSADGTVHRDIKPQNVALRNGRWDQPVILDLGMAKSVSESTFTRYPSWVGTDMYMAPEQLAAKRAKKAADLFAVGVTVRTALTGRHPFYQSGRTYTYDEAIAAIQSGADPLPEWVPEAVSEVLERLVSFAEHERGSARSNLKRLGTIV